MIKMILFALEGEEGAWLKVCGNGTFAAVANHSFLSPRGLAAVHLANRSCRAHTLVLDCNNYFYAFFQSICVYQPF